MNERRVLIDTLKSNVDRMCHQQRNGQKELGRRIAKERQRLGITQHELAEVIGFSRGSIGRLEAGEHECKTGTLIKLCCVFDVTTDYLIGIQG